MATLIPSLSTCISRMTSSERRLGERLEQKLDAGYQTMNLCADTMRHRKRLFNVRKHTGDYNPSADTIQIMTMKVSKGLEFPVVALPGVGHMPAAGEDVQEAARVFYVSATRATQRLVIGVGGYGAFGNRLGT
jgi:superfamily I DNA/RNA helicase